MSNEALMREAARCRRLADQATDPKLVAMLEAIALEYEARTFVPDTCGLGLEPIGADHAVAFARRV